MIWIIAYIAGAAASALFIVAMLQRSGEPLNRDDLLHFVVVVMIWPLFVFAYIGAHIGHLTRDRNEEVEHSTDNRVDDGGFYG